jgi:hypothetical protein
VKLLSSLRCSSQLAPTTLLKQVIFSKMRTEDGFFVIAKPGHTGLSTV